VTGEQLLPEVTQGIGIRDLGQNSLVEDNLVAGSQAEGIYLVRIQDSGVVIRDNLIGTDLRGSSALGNREGIRVDAEVQNVTIVHNTVSGNRTVGIAVSHQYGDPSFGHVIAGNVIGLTAEGSVALPNGLGGIFVQGHDITIGGDNPGEGNVISGNDGNGIVVDGVESQNVRVQGNYIGVDATGTVAIGNQGDGVRISDGASNNLVGLQIGGSPNPMEGNVIQFNSGPGISVVGSTSVGNALRGNSIVSNGGLGIDLGDDGVTADASGARSGPNRLQNYPLLLSASIPAVGSLRVTGVFPETQNGTYILDFYASTSPDPTGFGEGQRFLGSVDITTRSGKTPFDTTLFVSIRPGQWVTATATDEQGDTSEFDSGRRVVGRSPKTRTGDSNQIFGRYAGQVVRGDVDGDHPAKRTKALVPNVHEQWLVVSSLDVHYSCRKTHPLRKLAVPTSSGWIWSSDDALRDDEHGAVALPQLLPVRAVVRQEENRAVDDGQAAASDPEVPGKMSLTSTVPAAVPSLFHSSPPCVPSLAEKNSVPFTFVRDEGAV
jgi:parallel beta-helix repeat protein